MCTSGLRLGCSDLAQSGQITPLQLYMCLQLPRPDLTPSESCESTLGVCASGPEILEHRTKSSSMGSKLESGAHQKRRQGGKRQMIGFLHVRSLSSVVFVLVQSAAKGQEMGEATQQASSKPKGGKSGEGRG